MTHARRGFTLVEFMVLFGIFIILLSIFFPYLLKVRETDRRAVCTNNLRQIGDALSRYANDNGHNFPRVVYDEVNSPTGYKSFTGADDENPFAADSRVQPNDVTASLWLLLRQGYLKNAEVFICPGSTDTRDLMTDPAGRIVKATQRGNFRRPSNLSYSYASPFSNALNFKLNSDWLKQEFALMADKNPGVDETADVTRPAADADPITLSQANSHHHGRAGQNVLYLNSVVAFKRTPYAGAYYGKTAGDNIYTARAMHPATQPLEIAVFVNGYCGRNLSPAMPDDSYLVPTAQDGPSPVSSPALTTVPTTHAVTTAPMTTSPTTAPILASAPAPTTVRSPATAPATTQR